MRRAALFLFALVASTAAAKPVPADFLDVNVDDIALAKRHPAQAKVIVAGGRYERSDSPREARETGAMLDPVMVLDESNPKRLRVLCRDADYRIAAWLDADDLATLAKRDLVLVNKPPVIMKPKDESVGIHVRAGTVVDHAEPRSPGMVRASVRGLFFTAGGYARASNVGVTYLPPSETGAPAAKIRHGEIAQKLDVYDAPNGALLAHIEKAADVANTLLVHRIAAQGAWVKLSYDEDDVAVVGWAKREDVSWFKEPDDGAYGTGSMSGVGTGSPERFIDAKKGMHLFGAHSGDAIGVMLEDEKLPLAPDSTDDTALAEVSACGGTIEVAVRAP